MSTKQNDLLNTRFTNKEHKNYEKTEEELKFEYNNDGLAVSKV
jgi:hypothetical protein